MTESLKCNTLKNATEETDPAGDALPSGVMGGCSSDCSMAAMAAIRGIKASFNTKHTVRQTHLFNHNRGCKPCHLPRLTVSCCMREAEERALSGQATFMEVLSTLAHPENLKITHILTYILDFDSLRLFVSVNMELAKTLTCSCHHKHGSPWVGPPPPGLHKHGSSTAASNLTNSVQCYVCIDS